MNIQPKDVSKGHFYVSIAKSVIRIGAGIGFALGTFVIGGILIVIAEILGIIEEMV